MERLIIRNTWDVIAEAEGKLDAGEVRTVEVEALVDTGAHLCGLHKTTPEPHEFVVCNQPVVKIGFSTTALLIILSCMRKLFSGIVLPVIPAICLLFIMGCFDFYANEESALKRLENQNYPVAQREYEQGDRVLFAVEAGNPEDRLVVFVHGSPGEWNAFEEFLNDPELVKGARLVSVDRPGFGRSNPGEPERSLEAQAALLKPLLETNQSKQGAILIGHSMGGPVVARAAMDYPGLVGGVILVAASIDPELEEVKFIQKVAKWPVIRWMVPTMLYVTNEEILPLKGELEKMLPLWRSIRMPVTVIQGGKDTLVPPGNADFAERMLTGTQPKMVRKEDMNHFVPWEHPELIRAAIDDHLGRK